MPVTLTVCEGKDADNQPLYQIAVDEDSLFVSRPVLFQLIEVLYAIRQGKVEHITVTVKP